MPDMLVKLYELPPVVEGLNELAEQGITLRKPFGPERHVLVDWVRENFYDHWAAETDNAQSVHPVACYVAVKDNAFAGFSCYDTTSLGMYGPLGVAESMRGYGIGKALLLLTLKDMRNKGYSHAIIGNVGPITFYEKVVGATVIPDSDPGLLRTWVRKDD